VGQRRARGVLQQQQQEQRRLQRWERRRRRHGGAEQLSVRAPRVPHPPRLLRGTRSARAAWCENGSSEVTEQPFFFKKIKKVGKRKKKKKKGACFF
jgi:hypothetical protein